MASASTIPDYEELRGDLARTILKHRDDCPPFETARQLLEYDSPGHSALVGINFDATRAFLYHEEDRYVIGVDFGPDGLDDGGPVLAHFDFGSNVFQWVRKTTVYWSWLNPRFL